MDDGALTPRAAGAIGRAVRVLAAERPGLPLAELVALAEGVEGRPLRLDLAAAAQIGAPVLVLREVRAGDALAPLTPREREVASLVALGMSNRMIAEALGISLPTAKDHVHNALARLGMASRAELAAAVARDGG